MSYTIYLYQNLEEFEFESVYLLAEAFDLLTEKKVVRKNCAQYLVHELTEQNAVNGYIIISINPVRESEKKEFGEIDQNHCVTIDFSGGYTLKGWETLYDVVIAIFCRNSPSFLVDGNEPLMGRGEFLTDSVCGVEKRKQEIVDYFREHITD